MSAQASSPLAVSGTKRRYKSALSSSGDRGRNVVLTSFLTLGGYYELIGVEDTATGDDAYIQPIREEICGRGPYGGRYAKMMGLIHIASRRANEWSNDVLKRHTGAKKVNNEYVLDKNGSRIYFPRSFIVRMICDKERVLSDHEKVTTRRKVLNTLAKVRCGTRGLSLCYSIGVLLTWKPNFRPGPCASCAADSGGGRSSETPDTISRRFASCYCFCNHRCYRATTNKQKRPRNWTPSSGADIYPYQLLRSGPGVGPNSY